VYQTDRLGSVRALTNGSGAVSASYQTDEWGVPTVTTGGSAQPFGFTGEPRDGTGLTYLRSRYYDPDLGRFVTRDTWPGVASSPQTLNRYAYANNNPTTNTDPSGHFVDTLLDIGFIVFDVGSLVFGPPKDRGGNWLALGADIAAAGVPFVTGAGFVVRAGARTAANANDLHHLFGLAKHNLGDVVTHFGSEQAAYDAIQQAIQAATTRQGLTGIYRHVTVDVGGFAVTVSGNVVDGIARIGTAFIKP